MDTKELRVLHINCNYMGTKLHQTMIEHLEKYVPNNTVFCPIYKGSDIVTKPHENVIVSNCYSLLDRLLFFRKQRKIQESIQEKIHISQYQIIHAYTLFTDGNTALALSQKYGIPYVVAIRATDLQFLRYKPYLRARGLKILQNASAVYFLSDAMRRKILERYVPARYRSEIERKSKIVPNGIDDYWIDHRFYERNLEETQSRIQKKELKIICVAQIIKRKNIPMLQKAVQLLNNDGWKIQLTVIGKAVNEEETQKIKNDSNTVYLSPVPKEQLIEHYREADVFALPSKGETFGLVYAEAMSQGLPVIYSVDEGFDGQFEEGDVGYHIRPNEKDDIAGKIESVCASYKSISLRCTEKSQQFRWNDIVERYVDDYCRILKWRSFDGE